MYAYDPLPPIRRNRADDVVLVPVSRLNTGGVVPDNGYTDASGVYHMPGGDPVFTVTGTGSMMPVAEPRCGLVCLIVLAAIVYYVWRKR